MRIFHALLAALLVWVLPGLAQAQSFECISSGGGGQCAAAQSDLSWSFTGNNFTLTNNAVAGNTSFIGAIYFDYGAGMGVSLVSSTGTVALASGGSPPNLPSASSTSPNFVADAYWTANNPASAYGVNPGESITFAMSNVTAANFADGSMRVGVHLQGLPTGASESLVTAVPEPETYAMLLAGLGLMGAVVRRRSQAAAAV